MWQVITYAGNGGGAASAGGAAASAEVDTDAAGPFKSKDKGAAIAKAFAKVGLLRHRTPVTSDEWTMTLMMPVTHARPCCIAIDVGYYKQIHCAS